MALMTGFAAAGLARQSPFPTANMAVTRGVHRGRELQRAGISRGQSTQLQLNYFPNRAFSIGRVRGRVQALGDEKCGPMTQNNMTPRRKLNGAVEKRSIRFVGGICRLVAPDWFLAQRRVFFQRQRQFAGFSGSLSSARARPIESPAIARACRHAARGEFRELLALDAQLASEPLLQPFADGNGRRTESGGCNWSVCVRCAMSGWRGSI